MMANSARDPYWNAGVRRESIDHPESRAAIDEECSQCHLIGKEKLGTRESFMGGFVIGGPNSKGERLKFGPYAPDAGHARIVRTSTGGFLNGCPGSCGAPRAVTVKSAYQQLGSLNAHGPEIAVQPSQDFQFALLV